MLKRISALGSSGLGGVSFANPIPAADALPAALVESLVTEASDGGLAVQKGISGKALTPFLLARLAALSSGQTLRANRSLALNNARFAAALAVALAELSHA